MTEARVKELEAEHLNDLKINRQLHYDLQAQAAMCQQLRGILELIKSTDRDKIQALLNGGIVELTLKMTPSAAEIALRERCWTAGIESGWRAGVRAMHGDESKLLPSGILDVELILKELRAKERE